MSTLLKKIQTKLVWTILALDQEGGGETMFMLGLLSSAAQFGKRETGCDFKSKH
jgi:hypothetical protein